MQSCDNGETRVIRSAGHKKNESKDQDLRVSITMYLTGSVAGFTGPTIFLMEGKNNRANYTDKFLQYNVADPESTVLMMLTTLMYEEAWIDANPPAVCGIRSSNTIFVDNPQLCMPDILYGFVPHASTLKAMQLRVDTKIQSIKDEGDLLHVNQSYGKYMTVQ